MVGGNAILMLLLYSCVFSAPPLTDAQRTMLETVRDDRPLVADAGLDALLENVAQWEAQPEAEAAQFAEFFDDPQSHRGRLVLIDGPAKRITESALGYDGLEAWQIEIEGMERPVLVLIDMRGDAVHEQGRRGSPLHDSYDSLRIPARFWKRFHAARDDPTPTLVFVGRFPQVEAPPAIGKAAMIILALVLGLAALLLIVRMNAWRRRTLPWRSRPAEPSDEPEAPLPTDPADALAELRRRADNAGDHE